MKDDDKRNGSLIIYTYTQDAWGGEGRLCLVRKHLREHSCF